MLLIDKSDGVATVTINRPEAMNAMSRGLRVALDQTFKGLRDDDDIRAVVLTGAGERAFTAGLDLKELGVEGLGAANATTPDDNPVLAVLQCGKPVIGAINGVAITGGFELALACDVLIASTNARFADTHARVGITPGWGLSQKLSRIVGIYRAKELSLTGNFIDAATACDWGLVNRVVPAADLMAEHLGVSPATVAATIEETGSLIATIERLRGSGRSLRPYEVPDLDGVQEWLADNEILDPEGPGEMFEATTHRGLFRGRLKRR